MEWLFIMQSLWLPPSGFSAGDHVVYACCWVWVVASLMKAKVENRSFA